ncbi:MAG: hypothetical protein IJ563_01740 [Selenomonadaceae bacterium]|nr:hypothetical protein [Selenomonadaceae bacterium]MBR1857993.1 hypothetical protein [Selenomonadaceae bacterium]
MQEHEIKSWLKPIHNSIDKLVPTNRSLIDFINEKAMGNGIKRSLYKVKFIDKSEKSTYTCIGLTINELKKKLKERKISEEDSNIIIARANDILDEAKEQVERVYSEVRRYLITSELRTGCVQHHFKKIPSMSDNQNEAISKEIFSMALEYVNKSDKHSIDDVEEEFEKINKIALTLFSLASATESNKPAQNKKASHHKNKDSGSYNPLSLLENLW